MSRLDSLYKVKSKLETSDGKVVFLLDLNPAHSLFEGHFPNQPILPGVMQLRMVVDCVGRYYGKKVSLREVILAKYIKFIDPLVHAAIEISIEVPEADECVEIRAVLRYDTMIFTKCDLKVSLIANDD